LGIKLKKIIEFVRAHKPSSECKKETNLGMILGVIGIQLKNKGKKLGYDNNYVL
jgi:hypothetical protein